MSALSELISGRSEDPSVEYKAWMDTSEPKARAKLARHIAALSNHGGGYLVFGVDDESKRPMGETSLPRSLFTQDAIAGIVRRYLDPQPHVNVEDVPFDGVRYPVLIVPPHGARPIMAKSDGPQDEKQRPIGVREGAIYIRTAGPESIAIRSGDDWNALIDRCLVHRADLMGNIVRQAMAHAARRPAIGAEDLLAAAFDSTAEDFVSQTQTLADDVHPTAVPQVLEAGRSFSVVGYGLIGSEGELISLETLRSLNDRVAVSMHDYAYTGWASFLPRSVPERAPQIRTVKLLGRERSYMEGMRLPSTNLISAALDYWRIYEAGIAVTARGYPEDSFRRRNGGATPYLTFSQVLYVIHSLMAHARLLGQAITSLQQVIVRLDWRGLAGRRLMWDAENFIAPAEVVGDRFVRNVVLPWAQLRDSYFEALCRVLLPFLEMFPSAGWSSPSELLTRQVVERELQRLGTGVRLFDD